MVTIEGLTLAVVMDHVFNIHDWNNQYRDLKASLLTSIGNIWRTCWMLIIMTFWYVLILIAILHKALTKVMHKLLFDNRLTVASYN